MQSMECISILYYRDYVSKFILFFSCETKLKVKLLTNNFFLFTYHFFYRIKHNFVIVCSNFVYFMLDLIFVFVRMFKYVLLSKNNIFFSIANFITSFYLQYKKHPYFHFAIFIHRIFTERMKFFSHFLSSLQTYISYKLFYFPF